MMYQYHTARTVFSFVEFVAWTAVVIGVVLIVKGLFTFSEPETFGGGGSTILGVVLCFIGVISGMLGLLTVVIVQVGRATVDTASLTSELLIVSQQQLQYARTGTVNQASGFPNFAAKTPFARNQIPPTPPIERQATPETAKPAQETASAEAAPVPVPAPAPATLEPQPKPLSPPTETARQRVLSPQFEAQMAQVAERASQQISDKLKSVSETAVNASRSLAAKSSEKLSQAVKRIEPTIARATQRQSPTMEDKPANKEEMAALLLGIENDLEAQFSAQFEQSQAGMEQPTVSAKDKA
jgi:hypothetical protein